MTRLSLSRSMRLAVDDGLIDESTEVFDYGCGRGDDIRILAGRGVPCAGWDPAYFVENERRPADVVNLGYVVNVIERLDERAAVLCDAWKLARKLLIVSGRLTLERSGGVTTTWADGCLTSRSTFQKYFEQHELREWIEETLGVSAVAGAPGIFYVFRDPGAHEAYLASRYRRRQIVPRERRSVRLFEEHRVLFEALIEFLTRRGRLPDEAELTEAAALRGAVGSLRLAWKIVQEVTGSDPWNRIREERAQDLLVYLALARFGRRPRFAEVPFELQLDVRAFFGTYSNACAEADRLLFSAGNLSAIDEACRSSPVGKLTPSALYVHVSALGAVPPLLRVYEGCARSYIGGVEGANIVKLHLQKPQVSYLCYPRFERDGHPALAGSLVVPLQTFRVDYRDYSASANPPILHRKEEFVGADHPLRSRFARLTKQEERWDLYERPEAIGTREGWQTVLESRGVRVRGHRVVRCSGPG